MVHDVDFFVFIDLNFCLLWKGSMKEKELGLAIFVQIGSFLVNEKSAYWWGLHAYRTG